MALPSGAKRLKYIQSGSGQYINTGISPKSDNVIFECGWIEPTMVAGVTLFGSTGASSNWSAVHYRASNAVYLYLGGTGNACTVSNITAGAKNYLKTTISNGTVTCELNGTAATGTYSGSIQNGVNIGLFADIRTSDVIEKCACQMMYWRMRDNGTLVRDYIPCQLASGEVGMWDDVNGVFYGDAAGVGFIAGPPPYVASLAGETGGALVDSTIYAITEGGRCLVNGTGYAIKKGRTLIDGTGYDVSFDTSATVNITGSGISKNFTYARITIGGTQYTAAASDIVVVPGDVIPLYIRSTSSSYTASIVINGETVASVKNSSKTYDWTVPDTATLFSVNLSITAGSYGAGCGTITITY